MIGTDGCATAATHSDDRTVVLNACNSPVVNCSDGTVVLNGCDSPVINFNDQTTKLDGSVSGAVCWNNGSIELVAGYASVPGTTRAILNGCSNATVNFYPKSDDELVDYHRRLVEAIAKAVREGFERSRITAPVAFGKTFCLPYILSDSASRFGFHTMGVGLPWIGLADQTVVGIVERLIHVKKEANWRFVVSHSGEPHPDFTPGGRFADVVVHSSDPDTITEAYRRWRSEGLNVVFVFLYSSAPRLFSTLREADIQLDIALMDEAHNLSRDLVKLQMIAEIADPKLREELEKVEQNIVSIRQADTVTREMNQEHRLLAAERKRLLEQSELIPLAIPISRLVFLTATPTSNGERGERALENSAVFGEEIFDFTFAELVERGQAISPAIAETIVDPTSVSDEFDAEERYLVASLIVSLPKIQAHLGAVDVKAITYVKSVAEIEALCGEVFRTPSDFESYQDYVSYCDKVATSAARLKRLIKQHTGRDYQFIGSVGSQHMAVAERQKRFDQFERAENCVFVNCRTLAEGVNFPDANAAIVMRSADSIAVVQMFGRIVRISREDRDRMAQGLLQPSAANVAQYKKNKAMIVLCDRVRNDAEGEQRAVMMRVLQNYSTARFVEERGDPTDWQNENSLRRGSPGVFEGQNDMSDAIEDVTNSDLSATQFKTGKIFLPVEELF